MSCSKVSVDLRGELDQDEKRIDSDLEHLRDWLKKQPHLTARLDKQWLLGFLRGSKFRLEKAKKKLDENYSIRSALPEIFKDRDPMRPELQQIFDLGVLVVLGGGSELPVLLLRAGIFDPQYIQPEDVFKCHMMVADVLLLEATSAGDKQLLVDLVVEGSAFSAAHIHSPARSVQATLATRRCSPLRPRVIYLLNTSQIVTFVLGLVKPVLSRKVASRINVIPGSFEELYQTMPRKLFPNEFGGEAGSLEAIIAATKRKVESYRDWFLEDEKYGCDEARRPGHPRTRDELFGVDGSFRKLDID